jgi:hypothetical protein
MIRVLSPDGFDIYHDPFEYETIKEATEHLDKWVKRYEIQGYYSSNNGRIPLEQLKQYCKFVEET